LEKVTLDKKKFRKQFEKWLEVEISIRKAEITVLPEDYVEQFPFAKKLHLGRIDWERMSSEFLGKEKWNECKEWFVESRIATLDTEGTDWTLDIKNKFDGKTRRAFRNQNYTLEAFYALFCAYSGINISRRLRNTFLFQRLLDLGCY